MKSIWSLPKPVRPRNSKILLTVNFGARRQQFRSRGFVCQTKKFTHVNTFLFHYLFRCSPGRVIKHLIAEAEGRFIAWLSSSWVDRNAIIRLNLWNVNLAFRFDDWRTKPRNHSRYRLTTKIIVLCIFGFSVYLFRYYFWMSPISQTLLCRKRKPSSETSNTGDKDKTTEEKSGR